MFFGLSGRLRPFYLDRTERRGKNSGSAVCRLRKAFGDNLPVIAVGSGLPACSCTHPVILRQHTTCVASEPAPRHPVELNTDDAGHMFLILVVLEGFRERMVSQLHRVIARPVILFSVVDATRDGTKVVWVIPFKKNPAQFDQQVQHLLL